MKPAAKNEFSGNFSYVDNFDADNNKVGLKELNPRWMFLRDFVDCYKVENGKLKFNLLPGNIYKRWTSFRSVSAFLLNRSSDLRI